MLARRLATAFALVGAILTAGAAQTTSIWTGGHTDGQWHQVTNWDSNGIPDANTDIAVFDDSGAQLLVDLMTQTADVHQVRFENALPANDYQITNGTIHLLGFGGARGRIEQVGSMAGVNTISASIQADAGGADIVVRGSTLKLMGNNSTLDAGTVASIHSGGVLEVSDADGLGGATVNLAGGTLKIAAAAGSAVPVNGLIGYWAFDEANGDVTPDGSGLGNDGTVIPNASLAAGHLNDSMYFGSGGENQLNAVHVGNDLPLFGQSNDSGRSTSSPSRCGSRAMAFAATTASWATTRMALVPGAITGASTSRWGIPARTTSSIRSSCARAAMAE